MTTALVWFRHDLRLHDNSALRAALTECDTVVPVFVWAPQDEQPWAPGGASRWWLHNSLANLTADLQKRGGRLILRQASQAADALVELCGRSGASVVHAQRCLGQIHQRQEQAVAKALAKLGITLRLHEGQTLLPPASTTKADGSPFRVFTPFWRNFLKTYTPLAPLPAPRRLPVPEEIPSEALESLGLQPSIAWDTGIRETWRSGEQHALRLLDAFADSAIERYGAERDIPSIAGTSRLSPHLRFGEISPRQVAWRLWQDLQRGEISAKAHETYFRQLVWREFAYTILHHFPHTTDEPFNPQFRDFPWSMQRHDWLERWHNGTTGFPIVDAGMRELWRTGWMHNRVRMIVASFLTKHCGISWLAGARWFWDTLVDADLANNSMGWQWSAGCGVDAAPYFRIFNPLRQGEKFDPEGAYIRHWVPQLRDAPLALLHDPSRRAKVGLFDQDYPMPILDLDERRQEALATYQETRHRRRDHHV